MPRPQPALNRPNIVGSFGRAGTIPATSAAAAAEAADLLEIRLDLMVAEGTTPERGIWSHLLDMPLLFTARRKEEGSPIELSHANREKLIRLAIEDAALIDIEVASISEMSAVIEEMAHLGLPWVASYHDFGKLPSTAALETAAALAGDAGAAVFKAAARVNSAADVARLAEFQAADHGLPVATMGMGPLAPVSRLLCAQYGSVLNYGYIGETPTAPGQWSAAFLKDAVSRLTTL
ncbi:MAG: type I 3-dehydroquinate dehydratase [Akkermansiaceae bacterium]|nr:type I 3-dehydroquinate dehydratase [Akkermansiaceae bacterium]